MTNLSIFCILVLTTLSHTYLAQLNIVPIKSHKLLTYGMIPNQIELMYDKNPTTTGSFYSLKKAYVEVEFDLEKNYLIQHVFIRIKKELKAHEISFKVGNIFGEKGGLQYNCELVKDAEEIYKCQPLCRSGIIARRLVMRLLIPSGWISVYDIAVFSNHISVSDDISSNRLVLPLNCVSKTWLLTDKSSPVNASVPSTNSTDIYFEKPYIVTEVVAAFQNQPPKTLEITLMNESGKKSNLSISLSDCVSQDSQFNCTINGKTFVSRHLKVKTMGLTKIFVRGKTVFYPKLEIKTSKNDQEKLQISCEYRQCDLSVHSDCSPETINTGVKFTCANKRLFRSREIGDMAPFVIVNEGKVRSKWATTKFSVDSINGERMVVSMPRSYQYYGKYICACVADDKTKTEFVSDATNLKETDFLKDLFFETSVQYKLNEAENENEKAEGLLNVTNNIIYAPKSAIESFLTVKFTMYSLVQDNNITIEFPTNPRGTDISTTDRSNLVPIDAFKDIPASWSVAAHKYVIDEIYPDFVHGRGISIKCLSTRHKKQQNEFIRFIDEDTVKVSPSIWSAETGTKTVQVNIIYANTYEAILYHQEKNCINTNTSVLATFTNNKCSPKDDRLTCMNLNNAMFVTFKDEANFAKNIAIDLRNSKTNVTIEKFIVKNNIYLKQEDVEIKPLYKSLVQSPTTSSNTLKVTIKVISKIIADFIPCGSVTVNILIPGREEQKMILQNPTFEIDVEMKSANVTIGLELSIDNVQGKYRTQLQVTDPTTFSAKNVEFQEDQALNLLWHGIDDVAGDMLKSYELKIVTTILACNSTETHTKSIPKSQTSGAKNRYQAPMTAINQKHLTNMVVTIQPVFRGDKGGKVVIVERKFGTIGKTRVLGNNDSQKREQTIKVIPSQSELKCNVKKVQFSVTGINVEKFDYNSVSLGDMTYKIADLVPGRQYELTAKVIYMNGESDQVSEAYKFETADDISVPETNYFLKINEKVNISCTADIGPEDKFKKIVEWRRTDRSRLPDGMRSVISATNPRVAFLIMDKAVADYSNEYSCFAKPSANIGSAKITIVVNDLTISPIEQEVDFSKQPTITVTCSTSAVGQNNLMWIDPLGAKIPETGSESLSIKKEMTEDNVYKSILTIKKVTLSQSGVYKCQKPVGNITASAEFLLYGKEKLSVTELPTSSNFVGEKRRLRCSAEAGLRTQKVMWETLSVKGDPIKLMETSIPDVSVPTTQDIAIINSVDVDNVVCSLVPAIKSKQSQLSRSTKIVLKSKIVVDGPVEVKEGTNAKLTCAGYPSDKNMKLKWIFFPKENSTGSIVKVSGDLSKQKSYEPLRLDLNLTEVKSNRTGRYECKFTKESRGNIEQFGKSISLVIKPAASSEQIIDPKKSAHMTLANSVLTMLFTAIVFISSTVFHR